MLCHRPERAEACPSALVDLGPVAIRPDRRSLGVRLERSIVLPGCGVRDKYAQVSGEEWVNRTSGSSQGDLRAI